MSRRARAARRHRMQRGRHKKKFLIALVPVVVLVLLVVGGVAAFAIETWNKSDSIEDLKIIDRGAASVVYAADGSRLGYIQSDVVREPVDLEETTDRLQQATVAIEDTQFYKHKGVDYQAIVRAAWKNFQAGGTVEGASTITQQLARNLYLVDPDDTIERKIAEARLATEIEEKWDKDRILEEYLNTASYGTNNGRTAVGVEAASRIYFRKSAEDLNLAEAALIAGLPQAPSDYNPFLAPEEAVARRNDVLRAMATEGYISEEKRDRAIASPLRLKRGYKYERIREQYFFDYVEQELIAEYGTNSVRRGGLKVYTSIEPSKQAAATLATQAGAERLQGLDGTGPSAAIASINPDNGYIVAMASSADYATSRFNLPAQGKRQPGSSFKPFVLAEAIEQGIDPDKTFYDGSSPAKLQPPDGGPEWEVNNSDGGGSVMSVTSATTASVNVVFAKLDLDVGPQNVADMAHKLGITSELDGFPAEGIGGLRNGVSPLEMASAYATFAAGGIYHRPTAITRVEFPNGDVIQPKNPEGERVIDDGVAYHVTRILRTTVAGGTGTAANYGSCGSIAGKTGTTDEQSDAWFVGYTPELSTAVWTGYPDSRDSMGSGAFGGVYAAPIWSDFMEVANPVCGQFPLPTVYPTLRVHESDFTTIEEEEETEEEKAERKRKKREQREREREQEEGGNGGGNGGNGGGGSFEGGGGGAL